MVDGSYKRLRIGQGGGGRPFFYSIDRSHSIGNATVGPYFVGLMRWAVGLVARNVVGSAS